MVDQLKEIPKKILEWWNKFAPKQKTLIISAAAGVLVAFAVLVSSFILNGNYSESAIEKMPNMQAHSLNRYSKSNNCCFNSII